MSTIRKIRPRKTVVFILVLSMLTVSFSGCVEFMRSESFPASTPTPTPTVTATPTPTPTVSPTALQASIRGTVVQSGGYNLVKLEHQGGDTITVSHSTLIIRVGGYTTTERDFTRMITSGVLGTLARYNGTTTQQLSIGQCLYLWNDGTTNYFDITMGTPGADLPAAGSSVNIQIIDVASEQLIADLTVRG